MKRIIAVIIAAIMLLGITPAFADAPTIESIKYEGNGRVEVEFNGNVKYKNYKLKVTDENGIAYKTTVTERDSDEINFKVKGIKAGTSYKVVISGVKRRGTSGYGKVKATFATPAAQTGAPVIEDIEINSKGRIEVDFKSKVQYKNLKVKVKDAGGKKYSVSIIKKENDELRLKASGLKAGTTYVLVIDGIRKKGADEYVKVKAAFTTPAAQTGTLKIKKVESDAAKDEIEVDFNKDVEYGNLKVAVTSPSGESMTTYVVDKDEDSVDVLVPGLTAGVSYAVKVSGVRLMGTTGEYQTLSCTFTTPGSSDALDIKKVESDAAKDEIEVEFNRDVEYGSLKVAVVSASGKAMTANIVSRDEDSVDVRVVGLTAGVSYAVKVSGVRPLGTTGEYQTLSYTFTAEND